MVKGKKGRKQDPSLNEYAKLLGKKLRQFRENLGLSQAQFAKPLAFSPSQISKIEKGDDLPSLLFLKRLREKYHIDLDFFLSTEKKENEKYIFLGKNYILAKFYRDEKVIEATGTYLLSQSSCPLLFSEEFFRIYFYTSPKEILLFPVLGNSMEPTLPAKSIAIVKKQEKEEAVFEGEIYALVYENECYVKRIQKKRLPDNSIEWRLISDNPEYSPITFIEGNKVQFEIIGRVLGYLKNINL